MKAGTLRNIITIQQTTQTRNDAGEIVDTWATYSSPWAEILPLQGREFWAAQQVQNEQTLRILIRYNSGVNTRMRVIYDEKVWAIKSVSNVETRNGTTELIVTLLPNEYRDIFVVNNAEVLEVGKTTARIWFSTNALGDATITYSTAEDPYVVVDTETDDTDSLSKTLEFTGLTQNTTYYYKVQSQNAAGLLTATSRIKAFTTSASNSPVLSLTSSTVPTSTSVVIAFSTDIAGTTKIIYGKIGEPYFPYTYSNSSFATGFRVATLSGLTPGTQYYMMMYSMSSALSWGRYGTIRTFTTPGTGVIAVSLTDLLTDPW